MKNKVTKDFESIEEIFATTDAEEVCIRRKKDR